MSNIKKGKKLTVSTGDGIEGEQTTSLGVLEISGKGVSELVNNYNYGYDNPLHGKAQLVIGKTACFQRAWPILPFCSKQVSSPFNF